MPERQLNIVNGIAIGLFGIVCIDFFILGGLINRMLPKTYNEIAWYYVLAGLPHILASYVSYGNKEYITYYAKEIQKSLIFTGLLFIFFIIFLPSFFIYFFIVYTMYHVASQQIGMCKKYTKHAGLYTLWSISGTLAIVLVALSVGGESGVFVYPYVSYILKNIGAFFIVIFAGVGFYLFKEKKYPLSTNLAITFAGVSIFMGYSLIGILMIRFIHDVSAFCVYITHDTLYQKKYGDNVIYTFFKIPAKYIYIFLPVFSIVVSFLLQSVHSFVVASIIVMFAFNHYHLEGVVWKKGSLHRRTIG